MGQSIRASSILAICLGHSQQHSQQQQQRTSAHRHSRATAPSAPRWFLRPGQAVGFGIPCQGSRCLLCGITAPSSPTPTLAGICSSDFWRSCFGSKLCEQEASAPLTGLAFQGLGTCLGDTSSCSLLLSTLKPHWLKPPC